MHIKMRLPMSQSSSFVTPSGIVCFLFILHFQPVRTQYVERTSYGQCLSLVQYVSVRMPEYNLQKKNFPLGALSKVLFCVANLHLSYPFFILPLNICITLLCAKVFLISRHVPKKKYIAQPVSRLE